MVKTRSAETLALDKSQQKKVTKQTKQIKKDIEEGTIKLNKRKENKLKAEEKRGLIYIGHIPHGFYEEEMRNYFTQFGRITNVKVCRSRTSGGSKGFGYVEFAHPEVAKIAADSMNNYVMFKKRIVTEFVPHEKRPKGLFYGKSSTQQHTSVKSRRGKQKFSRNNILDEETVLQKRKKSVKKLNSKLKKLQGLGIECNIKPVGIDQKVLRKIKIERRSPESHHSESDDENSDSYKEKSKLITPTRTGAKRKSLKSLTTKRPLLTKSIESVRTLMSSKKFVKSQDEGTQTPALISPKKEKTNGTRKKLRGVVKVKEEKKALVLNNDVVKRIARELIRKRGNPLIDVAFTKPKKSTKKK